MISRGFCSSVTLKTLIYTAPIVTLLLLFSIAILSKTVHACTCGEVSATDPKFFCYEAGCHGVWCGSPVCTTQSGPGLECSVVCGGESCFLPGTQIQTPNGQVSIEAVKSQDKVLSLDPLSGQLYENIVSALHISAQDHYYTITTASGAKVQVTDEHPFYTGIRSTLAKSLPQKASATLSSLYIYLQDGWQIAKLKLQSKL